jgi:hypothetical protein
MGIGGGILVGMQLFGPQPESLFDFCQGGIGSEAEQGIAVSFMHHGLGKIGISGRFSKCCPSPEGLAGSRNEGVGLTQFNVPCPPYRGYIFYIRNKYFNTMKFSVSFLTASSLLLLMNACSQNSGKKESRPDALMMHIDSAYHPEQNFFLFATTAVYRKPDTGLRKQ